MSAGGRGLLWLGASCALLLAGFAAAVLGVFALGLATGSFQGSLRDYLMTGIYFRVVFFKGLLPQLVLALALWPLLRRLAPGVERSGARRAAGLALASLLAYAVVAPLLLSAELPGWPALQLRTPAHHVGTAVLCVAAVVAAALAGRRLTHRRADAAKP